MVASAEAQDIEEDIISVEASVGDLVSAEEVGNMAPKTWEFGSSLLTQEMIDELEKEGVPKESRRPP